MRRVFAAPLLAALLVSTRVGLADSPAPAAGAHEAPTRYLIKAARQFDGKSDAVVAPGAVLVEGHAIGGIDVRGGDMGADAFQRDGVKAPGVVQGVCNGADECRAAVRWQVKYGADVIKIAASGGVLSLADPVDVPQLSQDELDAIVE